jgi:hypothetical protein
MAASYSAGIQPSKGPGAENPSQQITKVPPLEATSRTGKTTRREARAGR